MTFPGRMVRDESKVAFLAEAPQEPCVTEPCVDAVRLQKSKVSRFPEKNGSAIRGLR
jgi:hypothetical protein